MGREGDAQPEQVNTDPRAATAAVNYSPHICLKDYSTLLQPASYCVWCARVCVCRMKKAEIPCPEVVLLKKHILVMSFIGKDHVPAPKLKDAMLGSEDLKKAYFQVLHVRILLYNYTWYCMCRYSDVDMTIA